MSKIKTIYKVYNGEMVEAGVIKETAKMVFVKRTEATGYSKTFDKEFVCVTREEAAQENLNKALTFHGMSEDRMRMAEERLSLAKKIFNEYAKHPVSKG
jgi:hypothetical protein